MSSMSESRINSCCMSPRGAPPLWLGPAPSVANSRSNSAANSASSESVEVTNHGPQRRTPLLCSPTSRPCCIRPCLPRVRLHLCRRFIHAVSPQSWHAASPRASSLSLSPLLSHSRNLPTKDASKHAPSLHAP
eukprot:3844862-Prymnesium_polylepis.1